MTAAAAKRRARGPSHESESPCSRAGGFSVEPNGLNTGGNFESQEICSYHDH